MRYPEPMSNSGSGERGLQDPESVGPAKPRLDPALVALARKIEAQPWNREGSDKTWVLEVLYQHRLFQAELRAAHRDEPA